MNLQLIDCHAHINSEFYHDDWKDVLDEALASGIWVINAGTNSKDSEENIIIANQYQEGVYASIGTHPTEKEEFNFIFFEKLTNNSKVVAIGECGLDYAIFAREHNETEKIEEAKNRQKNLFLNHIKLAKKVKKPLMLHIREEEAYNDAIEILEKENFSDSVIFHFYSGNLKQTEKILNKFNAFFTFGGVITFAREYDERINIIPLEKILLETDSPFVAPVPYRGQKNKPVYILETAKKMAEIKNVSLEEILKATIKNAKKVFSLNQLFYVFHN